MSQAQLMKKHFSKRSKNTSKTALLLPSVPQNLMFWGCGFQPFGWKMFYSVQEGTQLATFPAWANLCFMRNQNIVKYSETLLIWGSYELGCLENGAAQVLKNLNCSVSSCSLSSWPLLNFLSFKWHYGISTISISKFTGQSHLCKHLGCKHQ